MKEQVQQTGVRKWFGDDWLDIQNELMDIIEGHLGGFGKQFIVSGCKVAANTVTAGIVALNTTEGFKLCRFEGASGVLFPAYFKPQVVEDYRLYLDGDVKPATKTYNAVLSSTNSEGYLELKENNTTDQFVDIIQDSKHRFVTDDQIEGWNGAVESALSTIRGGIITSLNTLEKLRVHLQEKINNIDTGNFDVNEIYATIRGGIEPDLNTLKKLHESITGPYVRDLLISLLAEERLDAAAIKNLPGELSASIIRDKLASLTGNDRLAPAAIKDLKMIDMFTSDGNSTDDGKRIRGVYKKNSTGSNSKLLELLLPDSPTTTSHRAVSDLVFYEKIAELETRLDALGG